MTPLERLARDFLNSCRARGLRAKTIDQTYRPRLERQFLPWARAEGITEVAQLDQRAIERYQVHLQERGTLGVWSINSYVRTVNVFLSWARKEGEAVKAKAKLARTPQRIVPTLSREEIAAMERKAQDRDAMIVRLLADTGIRASELCGLRVGDLVEHERHDQIRVTGKGEKERLVPLPQETAKRLRRYIRSRPAGAESDRVFLSLRRGRTGEYEPLSISGLEQMIHHLARDAGIGRRVYPHIFRHTYITERLKAGVDSTKIRRVVGHTSTQLIDRVYGHLLDDDLAADILNSFR